MATTVGGDRISKLPDNIMVTILSGLPIDEAARCSMLASRWRHLLPSTLLDFKFFPSSCRDIVRAVPYILAAHPDEPIRFFRTDNLRFLREEKGAVDGWLRDLSNRGIEELFLYFDCYDRIPESLFACSSLKDLHAIMVTFPDTTEATAASLARLTEINPFDVKISEDSLNSILSQCTMLERLTIRIIGECASLHVRSQSLKVPENNSDFERIFIDDAPNLEQVFGRYMPERKVHIKVAHAPKLEFLGYLGMSNKIGIGDSSFTSSVPCIDNNLKRVVIEVYRGHAWQREMAKFLHGRSKFLKTMEFHCMGDGTRDGFSEPPSEEWVREQKELLLLDSRAAADASFLFFKGQLVVTHHEDCHDERYKREYYRDLYNESVLCGQNWRV